MNGIAPFFVFAVGEGFCFSPSTTLSLSPLYFSSLFPLYFPSPFAFPIQSNVAVSISHLTTTLRVSAALFFCRRLRQ